jgi:hypothetical protein
MFKKTTHEQELALRLLKLSREKEFRLVLNELMKEVQLSGGEKDKRMLIIAEQWMSRDLKNEVTSVSAWLTKMIDGPIPVDLQVFREAQMSPKIKQTCAVLLNKKKEEVKKAENQSQGLALGTKGARPSF